jgi:arylsulfatase
MAPGFIFGGRDKENRPMIFSENASWVGSRLRHLAVTLFALFVSYASAGSPNVVLVVMDNFGYGEVGVYGGGVLRGA